MTSHRAAEAQHGLVVDDECAIGSYDDIGAARHARLVIRFFGTVHGHYLHANVGPARGAGGLVRPPLRAYARYEVAR